MKKILLFLIIFLLKSNLSFSTPCKGAEGIHVKNSNGPPSSTGYGGFIANTAYVEKNRDGLSIPYIGPDVEVCDRTKVLGNPYLTGKLLFTGDSKIRGNVLIEGKANIQSSTISDYTHISGTSEISNSQISGKLTMNSVILANTELQGEKTYLYPFSLTGKIPEDGVELLQFLKAIIRNNDHPLLEVVLSQIGYNNVSQTLSQYIKEHEPDLLTELTSYFLVPDENIRITIPRLSIQAVHMLVDYYYRVGVLKNLPIVLGTPKEFELTLNSLALEPTFSQSFIVKSGSLHYMPLWVEKKEGEYRFIHPDSLGKLSLFAGIKNFITKNQISNEKVKILALDTKRQRDSGACTSFSLLDLKAIQEIQNGWVEIFTESIINQGPIRDDEETADHRTATGLSYWRWDSQNLPSGMLKLTQSLREITAIVPPNDPILEEIRETHLLLGPTRNPANGIIGQFFIESEIVLKLLLLNSLGADGALEMYSLPIVHPSLGNAYAYLTSLFSDRPVMTGVMKGLLGAQSWSILMGEGNAEYIKPSFKSLRFQIRPIAETAFHAAQVEILAPLQVPFGKRRISLKRDMKNRVYFEVKKP